MSKKGDPWPALRELADAARGAGQPDALFAAAERIMDRTFGHKLFTILEVREDQGYLERLYTNRPEAYPLMGRKPLTKTPFVQKLFERGEPNLGQNADDIRRDFPDHETLLGLGCESIMNLRIMYDGTVMGSMNVLHEANYFDEEDLENGMAFASLLTPAFVHRRAARG